MINRDNKKARVMIGQGSHSTFVTVPNGTKIMIGEGENACFVRAGETSEEFKKRINDKIDKLTEETEREKVKTKVLSLFKSNGE